MNAKKITSLVLAAIMAAGTTVTAFAAPTEDCQLEIIPGEKFYTEDDGVLVVDGDQQVAPGTSIYIPLAEWNGTGASTKDKNRFNVYADWKVGEDSVEDMDIVYKKGVDGIEAYDVSLGGKTLHIDAKDKRSLAALIAEEISDERDADSSYLSKEIADGLNELAEEGYEMTQTGKFYATPREVLEACGWKYGDYYTYARKTYENAEGAKLITENLSPLYPGIYASASDAEKGYGPYTKTPAGNVELPAGCYFTGGNFIDPSKVTTVEGVIDSGVVTGITKAAGNYMDGNGNVKTESDALEAEPAAVKASYVDENGMAMTADEAEEYVIDQIAAAAAEDVDVDYSTGYTYWIKIDTKEDKTTKLLDLAGTLTIGTSRSKAEDGKVYNLDTTMSNRTTPYNVVDEITIEANSNGAVKFDKEAEDVVIYFGDNEAAWYEFDARGQSALNFEWNMDFNREIADLFPKANIDFISWVAEPSTNRTGTLYITADADSYIYEVTEDGVKEVANAKYNEDEEAWEIRTRKLTAYAISDRELDTSITLDGEDNTSSSNTSNNGGKDNPDTGR